jgi:hypothetical protein
MPRVVALHAALALGLCSPCVSGLRAAVERWRAASAVRRDGTLA